MYHSLFKTELTANHSSPKDQLGIIRAEFSATYGWRYYKYVQAAADTTVANGTVLSYTDYTRTIVTSDIDDGHPNRPAGVGIGAITASYYGWIQVQGYHAAVITNADDDISAGDLLIVDTDEDGQCDSVAGGTACTYVPLGAAYAADVDASDTVAALLYCPF
jgi:hypothetical protein